MEFLLASDRGGAGVDTGSTVDVDLADGATTEAGRAFPGAEDLAEGAVTATGLGVDKPSVEADAVSEEEAADLVVAVGASEEATEASVEVDAASVAVVEASVDAAVASEVADTGEAEAVMAVGAGSFRHEVETLAAEGICSRPLCF